MINMLHILLQTYIIYTGHKFKDEATSVAIYHHLLEQVVPRLYYFLNFLSTCFFFLKILLLIIIDGHGL
jgi:hypothetical protein